MKKHKGIIFSLIAVVIIGIYIVIGFTRTKLVVSEYTIETDKIPEEFDGFKIVQISDLHDKNFGSNQLDLIQKVKDQKPDIIILTGDIVDKKNDDPEPVKDMLAGISQIAPVYFVTGNHELDMDSVNQYATMKEEFKTYDVTNLDDSYVEIKRGSSKIMLYGMQYRMYDMESFIQKTNPDTFNILMYHSSEAFSTIKGHGYDLVFSGHTHGGIIRLPFVGGVIGNSGSLFPKYSSGVYDESQSKLVSSRGLGDTKLKRFYNPPEIVSVTLKKK